MKEQIPLRVFVVERLTSGGASYDTEIKAHYFVVGPAGELSFSTWKDDINWTVEVLAPGKWSSVSVELPSSEDIESYKRDHLGRMRREQEAYARQVSLPASFPGAGNTPN